MKERIGVEYFPDGNQGTVTMLGWIEREVTRSVLWLPTGRDSRLCGSERVERQTLITAEIGGHRYRLRHEPALTPFSTVLYVSLIKGDPIPRELRARVKAIREDRKARDIASHVAAERRRLMYEAKQKEASHGEAQR